MENKFDYECIAPGEFTRHPLHEKMLLSPEEKNQCGYAESVQKYGKFRPVLYIEIGGKKYALDGLSFIEYAKENNMSHVLALKVSATTDEEILQVIAEANSTYHTSALSKYRMAEALYEEKAKGQGYRSDLEEAEKAEDAPDEGAEVEGNTDAEVSDYNESEVVEAAKPAKRKTIYEKIGEMMGGLSGTHIKHILFVGRFNIEYIKRMDTDRMSLYAAYMNCKSEERGDKPELPKVKAPIYISDDTGKPEFSEPTTTETNATTEAAHDKGLKAEPEVTPQNENELEAVGPVSSNSPCEPEFIVVKGICTACGKETEVRVNTNQFKK